MTQWSGLAVFASVRRWGIRDGKPFDTQSWFILNQNLPADRVAMLIREHRGAVENKLHWVKDVVQGGRRIWHSPCAVSHTDGLLQILGTFSFSECYSFFHNPCNTIIWTQPTKSTFFSLENHPYQFWGDMKPTLALAPPKLGAGGRIALFLRTS